MFYGKVKGEEGDVMSSTSGSPPRPQPSPHPPDQALSRPASPPLAQTRGTLGPTSAPACPPLPARPGPVCDPAPLSGRCPPGTSPPVLPNPHTLQPKRVFTYLSPLTLTIFNFCFFVLFLFFMFSIGSLISLYMSPVSIVTFIFSSKAPSPFRVSFLE